MNRHEFEVRYSEALIRRTTWTYFRMSVGRALKWSGWLMLTGLLAVWCWLLIDRVTGVMVWMIPAVIGTAALFLVTAWKVHIDHSLERLSRMKSPVVRVVADDENLSMSSDFGSSTTPWTAFTEWMDGPEAIYLKAGRGSLINLPIDGVDARALQFIRDRISAQQPTS